MGFNPFSPDDWVELGESTVSAVTGVPDALINKIGEPAAEMLVELANDMGDLPAEAGQFASDPERYVQEKIQAAVADTIKTAVTVGLGGELGKNILNEVGLRPLVDGVVEVADDINAVIQKVLEWQQCARHAAQHLFWIIVGAIVGARASRLLNSKEDCYWALEVGQLASLVVNLPERAMLECAIKVAFEVPLPQPRATQRGPNVPAVPHPIEAVFAVMRPQRSYEEMFLMSWSVKDLKATINEHWAYGWRVAQISGYLAWGAPYFHIVLKRTNEDQKLLLMSHWRDFESESHRLFVEGYICTTITALQPSQMELGDDLEPGELYYCAAFERPEGGRVLSPVDMVLNYNTAFQRQIESKRLQERIGEHRAEGFEPHFMLPYEAVVPTDRVDIIGDRPWVVRQMFCTVLSRKIPTNGAGYYHEAALLPFRQFVVRDEQQRAKRFELFSLAVCERFSGELYVAAVWRIKRAPVVNASDSAANLGHVVSAVPVALPDSVVRAGGGVRRRQPPTTQPAPAPPPRQLVFHGWPNADFLSQYNELAANGWSVAAIAGYAT